MHLLKQSIVIRECAIVVGVVVEAVVAVVALVLAVLVAGVVAVDAMATSNEEVE